MGGIPDGDGTPVLLRAGVHPLQFYPSLAGRRFDVGAGYRMENSPRDSGWQRGGPYAEVGMYPFQSVLGASYRVRAGALALGEYFLLDDRGYRAGIGTSAAFELVGFTRGVLDTDDVTGLMWGEWGIGAFAGPGLRVGDRGETWAGTFGISARIPFMAGVVCCIDPTDHEDTAGARRNR